MSPPPKFRSVQNGIYALRKAHMCSTLPQSQKFPPRLKQFQCSSDSWWPCLILSKKIILRFFFPSLFLQSGQSMVWCPSLVVFVVTGSLKLLNISDLPRRKTFVMVALLTSLFTQSFPFTLAYPGYTHCGCWPLTHSSFPFHLSQTHRICEEDGMCGQSHQRL